MTSQNGQNEYLGMGMLLTDDSPIKSALLVVITLRVRIDGMVTVKEVIETGTRIAGSDGALVAMSLLQLLEGEKALELDKERDVLSEPSRGHFIRFCLAHIDAAEAFMNNINDN